MRPYRYLEWPKYMFIWRIELSEHKSAFKASFWTQVPVTCNPNRNNRSQVEKLIWKPITRTCYRAGKRVEETFPKYEMIGTHAGHSDYQAMKPYIAIAEKTKADAMKLFDEEQKK